MTRLKKALTKSNLTIHTRLHQLMNQRILMIFLIAHFSDTKKAAFGC